LRPSVLGCLGTIVITYLLLAIAVVYVGVATGVIVVLSLVLFAGGASTNLLVRSLLGIFFRNENSNSVVLGRVSLAIVFLAPLVLLLVALPLAMRYQSSESLWPLIVWSAALLVALPSYYWMYFAAEIPWVHWKLKLPFPTEKAMRREGKEIFRVLSWLLWSGANEDQEPPRGSLTLGKGIPGVNLIEPQHDFVLEPGARATHTFVIGQPGTGKSRALESWIMQDIRAGQGVGVIDPHGQLFDHVLSRIAELTEEDPSLAERVVIINPLDRRWTVGFNPLEAMQGISTERLALFLTDVVIKIWQVDTASAPRMIRLLTFTFLALAELGLRLADLPRFLQDEEWREELLSHTTHLEVVNYFQFEFPKNEGGKHQWITPVLNKVGALFFDNDVRLIFSAKSTINFRRVLDDGLILLVNLSKGQLAEGNSALLGAFIVAHIQKAALARPEGASRKPFYLYLDEFQNYTTDNIKDVLSESRKYGLSLILAHQFLSQLSHDLLGAVLNTTGAIASFRVGYEDASTLSRELFPPGYVEIAHSEVKFRHVGRYTVFPFPHQETETLLHEERAALLTQLDHREFWVKRRGPYVPSKQRTLDMPDPVMSEGLLKARGQLLEISGQRYGRLKQEVREELEHERQQLVKRLGSKPADITDYEET
jgi:hypothetical protein